MKALCLVLFVLFGLGATAHAEEPGTWRFQDASKPTKLVVVGGSVAAYEAGSFGQWLSHVCAKVEVVNRAKAKLGAFELRQRFIAQVLKNRRVDPKAHETWLLFLGGLNSVGTPEKTNLEVGKALQAAKDAGLKTVGISINPWGAESDHRWQGVDGLAYFEHTQKTVDFLLGRLTPAEAFGKDASNFVDPRAPNSYQSGILPDIGVDVWDATLRDRDAKPRDRDKLLKTAKRSGWVKKRLALVPEAERAAKLQALVDQAAALPQWYMKPHFHAFDPIHPNGSGHKEIARAICAKAPASWGCDCKRFDALEWDRRTNAPKAL